MCLSLPFITHSHQLLVISNPLSVSMDLLVQTFHINEPGRYVASVSGFFPSASCFEVHPCGSVDRRCVPSAAVCGLWPSLWELHPFSPLLTRPQLSSLGSAPSPLGKCRHSFHFEQTGVDHPTDSSPTEHFRGLGRSQGVVPETLSLQLSPGPGPGYPLAAGPAPPWHPEGRCRLHLGTVWAPRAPACPAALPRGEAGAGKAASPQLRQHLAQALAQAAPPNQAGLQAPAAAALSQAGGAAAGKQGPAGAALECAGMPSTARCQAGAWRPGPGKVAGTSIPGATGQAPS